MSQVTCHRPSQRSLRDELGATAVEYAMMIALIAFVIMGAVSILGDRVGDAFGGVDAAILNSPASANDGGGDGDGGDGGGGSGDNNGWGDGVGGGQGHND